MVKKSLLIMMIALLASLLAACGGGDDEPTSSSVDNSAEQGAVAAGDTANTAASGSESDPVPVALAETQTDTAVDSAPAVDDEAPAALTEDFDGALSLIGQLALGTVQLEGTDLAVDEAQAAELLPLWQALQALSASDTTADIELQAVVKQVNQTMTSAQIAAIAAMKLSDDKVTSLMESGELAFGGFGRQSGAGAGNGAGFRGGGSGGEFPGGGPGGGPGLGGFGGLGGGAISEDDLATRRAQFEESGVGMVSDRLLTGMVIRLLQDKTGLVDIRQIRGQITAEAFQAVADAAGLPIETLQEKMASGQTLASVVEENGGDIALLQEQLAELFSGLPDADELDIQQVTADWLGIDASN